MHGLLQLIMDESLINLCLGSGKSRFARECILHLAHVAADNLRLDRPLNSDDDTMQQVAQHVVRLAWPDASGEQREAQRIDLVKALVAACFEDRNLIFNFAHYGSDILLSDTAVAAILTAEHFKYRLKSEFQFNDLYKELCTAFKLLPDVTCDPLSVAMSLICDGDHKRAVLINLDEAQDPETKTVSRIIGLLAKTTLMFGWRVFVTVTGVNPKSVGEVVWASGLRAVTITLPLLKQTSMFQILQHLFKLDVTLSGVPMSLAYIMFWMGGIPRNLQHFLSFVANRPKSASAVSSATPGHRKPPCTLHISLMVLVVHLKLQQCYLLVQPV